jgi:molybdopterin molybdotransferase
MGVGDDAEVDDLAAERRQQAAHGEAVGIVDLAGGKRPAGIDQFVAELGSLDLWKLNIKPGKPLAFGHIGGTPFIGLPGNPVSVFVTFVILARPLLLKLMGARDLAPPVCRVAAGFDWPKPQLRREFVRVRLEAGETGPVLVAFPHQGSGVLSSAAWGHGLAIAREGVAFAKGEPIDYLPFSGLFG